MSKVQSRPTPAKKPIPPPVRPQTIAGTGAKKPIPAPVRPQTNVAKKPIPAPVRPQSAPAAKRPTPASARPQNAAASKVTGATKAPAQAAQTAQAAAGGNWISRMVQGQVQKVGDYAGGYVNGWGEAVNKVGENLGGKVTDQTRYWGQGVSGYGNDMKDAVGIGGTRISTAGNPLGMAGMGSGKALAPGQKTVPKASGGGTGSNPLGI